MTQFDEELAELWRRYRPDVPAGSQLSRRLDNGNPEREPGKHPLNQSVASAVPAIPTVPTDFDNIHGRVPTEAAENRSGEWEERAAILEYEGGLSRYEAERLAAEQLRP